MSRKEIVVDPQTEVTSDLTGHTMTVNTSSVPAPVTLTIKGTVDGKPYTKTLSALDLLPTEWEYVREFAEMTDHSENPLLAYFTPESNGGGGKTANERLQHIRTWAKSVGKEIGGKGRVPKSIVAEYDAAKPEGYKPADAS
jgi:Lsr2